LLQTAEAV